MLDMLTVADDPGDVPALALVRQGVGALLQGWLRPAAPDGAHGELAPAVRAGGGGSEEGPEGEAHGAARVAQLSAGDLRLRLAPGPVVLVVAPLSPVADRAEAAEAVDGEDGAGAGKGRIGQVGEGGNLDWLVVCVT